MGFWSKVIDDRQKEINPIHIMMAFLMVNSVAWVWYLILKNRVMPELQGVALLLGGGGIANLVHKADDIIAGFRKPKDVPDSGTDVSDPGTAVVKKKTDNL
jgi:hypothetical protein